MTGLLDCVNENADVTIVISDNETTAMTGGQDSAGTGRIEAICTGLGVDPAHIRVMTPLKKNYEEMKQTLREELNYHGVSVIIPRRECIQTLGPQNRNNVLVKGSNANCCWTSRARPSMPLRRSV